MAGVSIPGIDMPGKFVSAPILHGNTPAIPQFDDVVSMFHPEPGLFQIFQPGTQLSPAKFLDNRHDVRTMNLRNIANEMVIAQAPRSAGQRVTLFSNHHLRSELTGPDCGH